MKQLRVELNERSYDILIGDGLLVSAGVPIAKILKGKRAVIVTDENVAPLYLETLTASLTKSDIAAQPIILPAGEQTKSFAELEKLLTSLLLLNPDRKTALIALGGGVIGDLTGFAASILLRGVDFIQVPTTLLSQVDSAVGGKTGINTAQGKNLIGSFYQPLLVLADTQVLDSLPHRELLAGYAEVVKYGIINDAPFFAWLEENGLAALKSDKNARAHMVLKSCEAKAVVVGEDERESGLRAILNFGHTLGHALEAETGFSHRLLHGEAVAIGMVLAMKLSVMHGLATSEDVERVKNLLKSAGLKTSPRDVQQDWNADRLIKHCYHDKKASDNNLTFILAKNIGKTIISHDIKRDDLAALLADALEIV